MEVVRIGENGTASRAEDGTVSRAFELGENNTNIY